MTIVNLVLLYFRVLCVAFTAMMETHLKRGLHVLLNFETKKTVILRLVNDVSETATTVTQGVKFDLGNGDVLYICIIKIRAGCERGCVF